MAQLQSALSELAEWLTGTDPTLTTALADIVRAGLLDLIEAELTARIGAEPGERTPLRTAQRNGRRVRSVLRRRSGCGEPAQDPPQRQADGVSSSNFALSPVDR